MQVTTQTHLTMLRNLLNFRLSGLRADIHATALARNPADTGGVTDRKDEADLAQHAALDQAQEQRDLAELRQVEAALDRLDAGAYGDCADCGESIAWDRLLAQPAAERCAPCQGAFERRQRLHGGA
jgi:DnaK suppressor protein